VLCAFGAALHDCCDVQLMRCPCALPAARSSFCGWCVFCVLCIWRLFRGLPLAGMLQTEEEEKLRVHAIAMLFDEGEDSVDLDTFKRRSMRNKIVLNCYSIFEVAFGALLSRMQKLTGSQKVFGAQLRSLKMLQSPCVPEVVHMTVAHIRNAHGGMDTQGWLSVLLIGVCVCVCT
jgi:hypothetical protein